MATRGETQTRTDDPDISHDEAFGLLSSHRRRYALHIAKQASGPLEISDIAEKVAAWENGKDRARVTSDERHRVYTSLQQTHLPAMDRAGVINYDNGTVTLTEHAANLDIYMDVVPENSIPWGQYYFGLAGISAATMASGWLGVFPPSVSSPVLGTVVTVLFLVSALYHVRQNQKQQLGSGETPPDVER